MPRHPVSDVSLSRPSPKPLPQVSPWTPNSDGRRQTVSLPVGLQPPLHWVSLVDFGGPVLQARSGTLFFPCSTHWVYRTLGGTRTGREGDSPVTQRVGSRGRVRFVWVRVSLQVEVIVTTQTV